MQFIPSTWAIVGVDADNDGQRNPQDIYDAALGSAVYLCSGSDDLATDAGQRSAVFRYNHSQRYVDLVLAIDAGLPARRLRVGAQRHDVAPASRFGDPPVAVAHGAPRTTTTGRQHHGHHTTTHRPRPDRGAHLRPDGRTQRRPDRRGNPTRPTATAATRRCTIPPGGGLPTKLVHAAQRARPLHPLGRPDDPHPGRRRSCSAWPRG